MSPGEGGIRSGVLRTMQKNVYCCIPATRTVQRSASYVACRPPTLFPGLVAVRTVCASCGIKTQEPLGYGRRGHKRRPGEPRDSSEHQEPMGYEGRCHKHRVDTNTAKPHATTQEAESPCTPPLFVHTVCVLCLCSVCMFCVYVLCVLVT